MMKNFKIDSKKKRIAFEIIVLIVTILTCSIIYLVGEYFENKTYKKQEEIQLEINALSNNTFRKTYNDLESYNRINDYTYESFKKNILDDKDSSFLRMIHYRLGINSDKFKNEKSFEEFVNSFEFDSINQIDDQITMLKKQYDILLQQSLNKNANHIILNIILLIIFYPLRFIYYLLKWSIKILKEKETSKNGKSAEDKLPQNNAIDLIHEDQISTSLTSPSNENKKQLINKISFLLVYILIFWALSFTIVFISFYFLGPQPEIIICIGFIISTLITYKIYKLNYSKINFLKLSSFTVLIFGAFLWALIIGIPQYYMNYSLDLLSGKSNIGETPFQFYTGLFSGVVANFLIFGFVSLYVTIYFALTKKQINRNFVFLCFTSIVFILLIFRFTGSMYTAVITDERKVLELREILSDYKSKTEHQYPENVRQNFINSCLQNGGSQQTCSCVYDKIQRRFTFEEYVKIESEIISGQMPEYFNNFISNAKSECNQ